VNGGRRFFARSITLTASALFVGVALARTIAGPLHLDFWGASLSIRTLWRPLIAGVLLWLAGVALDRARQVPRALATLGRLLLGAVAIASVIGWLVFLSTTCGGADSYGYVSAAHRLLDGVLVQDEPLARILPFEGAIFAATPLGYTPSTQVANASVPVYPLGLPALMAGAITIAGGEAPFSVAPICGVALLIAVFLTARALAFETDVALGAVALTAVHPVVFTYSIQPMSDVPAAAFFVGAVASLARERPQAVLGGSAAALALLIRPALGPAVLALTVLPSLRQRRLELHSTIRFLIPLLCGVALQMASQWYLYGHPLANGYGDVGALFSLDRLADNVRSHGYWAWRALGPLFLGSAAIGLAVSSRFTRLTLLIVASTVAAPYLVYRTFDHWETLRFLLPALTLLTIPAAAGVLSLGRRLAGANSGVLVASGLTLAMAYSWTMWLRDATVFVMAEQETRYRLAGELVTQTTARDAVVLAQLHSGSIRYYSNRQSLDWDRIPAGALPATLDALRAAGHPVYVLFDGDEERALFERRHGPTDRWLPGGQRRNVQVLEAPRDAAAGTSP
jgi:hypothetical protein